MGEIAFAFKVEVRDAAGDVVSEGPMEKARINDPFGHSRAIESLEYGVEINGQPHTFKITFEPHLQLAEPLLGGERVDG